MRKIRDAEREEMSDGDEAIMPCAQRDLTSTEFLDLLSTKGVVRLTDNDEQFVDL